MRTLIIILAFTLSCSAFADTKLHLSLEEPQLGMTYLADYLTYFEVLDVENKDKIDKSKVIPAGTYEVIAPIMTFDCVSDELMDSKGKPFKAQVANIKSNIHSLWVEISRSPCN